MAHNDFALALNERNRDPRVACVVLADVSGSMSGDPITQLQAGYADFTRYLQRDALASKRAEVAVVTFGSTANVLVPFQEGRALEPVSFGVDGSTNMAAGINLALDMIFERKQEYKEAGIEYYRPWLLVLTDGSPDLEGFDNAVKRLNETEASRGVTVFPVAVGANVNHQQLARLSKLRAPAPMAGLKFGEFFMWLSASLSAVSDSNTFGASDAALESGSEQVQLAPPTGWTTA